ncbi:MAG: transcription antitermination factor NusB [Acidimicrobiales bacterium]
MSAGRRVARERALELLYEAEAKGVAPDELVRELPVAPDPYAAEVAAGIGEHQAELDGRIRRLATGWPLERMAALDRALLRMGLYELAHRPDVPTGVVLSEAVELAQQYSTDQSARFVNGVLARAAAELRPGAARQPQGDGDPAP